MKAAASTLTGRKRRVVVALLSAASMSAVSGCGLSEDAPEAVPLSDVGPIVPAPDPLLGSPIADNAALAGAMLVSTELPDGYVLIPDPVRDLGLDPAPEYDAADKSGTDPQSCAEVLAALAQQSPGAAADAEIRFSGPDFSSIDEDAASYTDNGAADAFAAVQKRLQTAGHTREPTPTASSSTIDWVDASTTRSAMHRHRSDSRPGARASPSSPRQWWPSSIERCSNWW